MRQVGQQVDALETQVRDLDEQLQEILLALPNLPRPDVPVGEGEEGNVVVRQEGEVPSFSFTIGASQCANTGLSVIIDRNCQVSPWSVEAYSTGRARDRQAL